MIKHFKSVTKRDGTFANFDNKTIIADILRAGKASEEFSSDSVADRLSTKVLSIAVEKFPNGDISVDNIQDIVEEVLLSSSYKKTAKYYIIQRDHDQQLKDIASAFNVNTVDKYLNNRDWKISENSNMSYSLQGLNNYISSEICKTYWLNKIYSKDIKIAHNECKLHIHDLNSISNYCCGWSLEDLLMLGFTGVPGKIESQPAKHFRSALGQAVNFFFTLQGEAAGAQAFSNFDTLLAPFIRYDNLTECEVKQALQEFMFNMNVPTRTGFQSPFTNVTLDLNVPSYFKDQGVIIGGIRQTETYGEFQTELDLFNKMFLEVMLEGDASGRVFTFPIPTYNITKDFDWDNPKLENLWAMTAKYGVPYFANFINSDMKPEDARSMCCRLRIDNRELNNKGGGLFGAAPLTGSIGVVTLNLSQLGYKSENEKEFFIELDKLLDISKASLETKRKVIEQLTEDNLYPYTKFYLKSVKQRFNSYWKNHFSTIGINGMHECCLNLLNSGILTPEGKVFSEKVLDHIRAKLKEYQIETGNNYNLEATPAEGVSYRFAKYDTKKFKDIKLECTSKDEPFYTNSTHIPVQHTEDVFEVLDHQDTMQSKYTGGTVIHLFLGERIEDSNQVKQLVKSVCTKYKLPYFTLSPTFSVCPTCGYLVGEHIKCGKCACTCEVYSRIVGYLRPVNQWNAGKKAEFLQRKTYKVTNEKA